MNKHIESEIKQIIDSICTQEMFYYCSFCQKLLGKAELDKNMLCKSCGSVTVDLREYIG